MSHKALIEAELEQQKKEIISKLEKGQVLEGKVKNITPYGVFVDLGGVDGLVHITDLSCRVSDPREVVELDQDIKVVIIDFDDEKKTHRSRSQAAYAPSPGIILMPISKLATTFTARLSLWLTTAHSLRCSRGVEGLVHVSEMSWSQHLRSARTSSRLVTRSKLLSSTLDRDERKMSLLGLKQLKNDPPENIEEKYAIGSRHTAKVRNFTNFGVFVEIEEGVDGLIHISDLSTDQEKSNTPQSSLQVGVNDIEVQVLEIDKDNSSSFSRSQAARRESTGCIRDSIHCGLYPRS